MVPLQEKLQRHCYQGMCAPLIFSELSRNAAVGAARRMSDEAITSMEFKEKEPAAGE